MDDPRPEVRIGDRERREVDDRLQKAHADGVLTLVEYEERSGQCWAARTRSELAPLTADLPDSEPDPTAATRAVVEKPDPAPVATPATAPKRSLAGGLMALVLVGVGIYGGAQVVTADDGFSIFGGRTLTVGPTDDRIEVGFLFGGTRIVVPPDANVRTEGGVIFGGTSCRAACDGTGTREVVVDATGAFGGLTILRQGEQVSDNDFGNNRDNDQDDNDSNNGNNNNNDDDDDED